MSTIDAGYGPCRLHWDPVLTVSAGNSLVVHFVDSPGKELYLGKGGKSVDYWW
jgi:hypothetical protein